MKMMETGSRFARILDKGLRKFILTKRYALYKFTFYLLTYFTYLPYTSRLGEEQVV